MMQASMIVSDWQPEIGRSPTPEQLRDIFQKELMDLGPALFLADKSGASRNRIALYKVDRGPTIVIRPDSLE